MLKKSKQINVGFEILNRRRTFNFHVVVEQMETKLSHGLVRREKERGWREERYDQVWLWLMRSDWLI